MRDRARTATALLAAVLALVLAGCVGIPTSGSVEVGQTLEEQDSGDFEFFPLGPVEGADQEAILSGFVAAFTGSADDFKVAREFLSADFSDEWNPRSGVTVRTSAQRFTTVGATSMEYSVSAAATVDATGAYRQNIDPVPVTVPVEFVQEDGEWRISRTRDGIVLADATFRSIFDTHALYFLDPTATSLVPDLRWFPSGSAALRVVSALLAGPPDWLRGAVGTAFPEGTALVAPSVEVESGVANVDLSPEALAANAAERQLMQLQLSESLADLPNIRRVSISVSGTPLEVADPGPSAPRANPQVDSRPVALKDGVFGHLVRDAVIPIPLLGDTVVDTMPTGATIANERVDVAVLGAEGVSIVREGAGGAILLDGRAGLVTPSLDNSGYVWSASGTSPSAIRVFDFAGAFTDVPTGLGASATIVSVDVSRDGARIAIFASTPGGPRLLVKAINRDANANQAPVSLSEAVLDGGAQSGVALDATWVDELTVATLSRAGDQRSVMLYEIGGERTSLSGPAAAEAIVGGNGRAGLRVVDESGTILARSGNSWTNTGVVVSFLATQR